MKFWQLCFVLWSLLTKTKYPVYQNEKLNLFEIEIKKIGLDIKFQKFRTFFELISSGCLLLSKLSIEISSNECLSFLDPCTNLDAFETVLTPQQCEDLTASAQHAIRLLTFKRINEILAL